MSQIRSNKTWIAIILHPNPITAKAKRARRQLSIASQARKVKLLVINNLKVTNKKSLMGKAILINWIDQFTLF
jgi:hypothetical protein